MRIILKKPIHFLDMSSAQGLCARGKCFGPGEYDIDIVDSPNPSLGNVKWVKICGTCWGVSKKFLEQWKHLGDNSSVLIVDDMRGDYVGPVIKDDSKIKF